MLAYLESLCSALTSRDSRIISELLQHPLATALPTSVLEEARRIATQRGDEPVAPMHALRLYHQTAHLLGACTDPATRRRSGAAAVSTLPSGERARQIELELPFRAAVALA